MKLRVTATFSRRSILLKFFYLFFSKDLTVRNQCTGVQTTTCHAMPG